MPSTTHSTPDTAPRHAGRTPTAEERSELERRALVAYHQARKGSPDEAPAAPVQARWASKAKTDRATGERHALHFVVIHAGVDVLAVYRVRPVKDYFMLRRLVRWPGDLVRLKVQDTA